MLSHRFWSTRFGAQRDIVGRDIRLDGESFRVIGVMPEGFGYPNRDIDAWMPFAFTPQQTSDAARGNQFSVSLGRLRPGATIDGLNAELAAIVSRNVAEGRLNPDAVTVAGFTGRAQALRDNQVGDLAQMLLLLQGIVAAVLLIACANVANLQLARVTARRKELAVRAALGAAGARLVRLVLVESLVLALGGAALGLALALGGIELVRALGLDRASDGFALTLDAPCLAFTLGTAIVAALVSGLPPVIALLRDDLTRAVREAGRQSGGGRDAHALRSALVVAQLGMSLALLVGAGLLTKSFYALQTEGAGFDASGVWTARIGLPASRYSGDAGVLFEQQALAALRALPGVAQAGFTSILPFAGNNDQGSTVIEGYVPPAGASPPHAQHRSIDEGYLADARHPGDRGPQLQRDRERARRDRRRERGGALLAERQRARPARAPRSRPVGSLVDDRRRRARREAGEPRRRPAQGNDVLALFAAADAHRSVHAAHDAAARAAHARRECRDRGARPRARAFRADADGRRACCARWVRSERRWCSRSCSRASRSRWP